MYIVNNPFTNLFTNFYFIGASKVHCFLLASRRGLRLLPASQAGIQVIGNFRGPVPILCG